MNIEILRGWRVTNRLSTSQEDQRYTEDQPTKNAQHIKTKSFISYNQQIILSHFLERDASPFPRMF